jgi:flagellar motor component MotA
MRQTWMARRLSQMLYLCLLAEAVFFYRSPEVLIVVVVSGVFCLLVQPHEDFVLRRTTVVGGVLAYAFSVFKHRLESRMETLAMVASETRDEARRDFP